MNIKIKNIDNASRTELESYIAESWGDYELDDYTTKQLRDMVKKQGEVDLFLEFMS
jgi:hypothetical protein